MSSLAEKKVKLQIMKLDTSIMEYELKIEERLEDIKRIKYEIEKCKETKEGLEDSIK